MRDSYYEGVEEDDFGVVTGQEATAADIETIDGLMIDGGYGLQVED